MHNTATIMPPQWLNKTTFAIGLIMAMLTGHVTASPNYVEVDKELEILSNLLTTVLKQEQRDGNIKFTGIESQYLSGQGVVLSVNTNQRFGGYSVLNFPSGINVPVPPEPPRLFFKRREWLDSGVADAPDVEVIIEDRVDEVVKMFDKESDSFRETRLKARGLARDLRSVERETEALRFELEQAEEKRKKEIEKRIQALEEQTKENNIKREKLKEEAEKLAKQYKLKHEEKIAEAKQLKLEFLSSFEALVSDNLCRFAGALRSIPSNEHISFVLPKFDSDVSRSNKDRIYVFKMRDVIDCSQDKIKPTKLVSNAEIYDF